MNRRLGMHRRPILWTRKKYIALLVALVLSTAVVEAGIYYFSHRPAKIVTETVVVHGKKIVVTEQKEPGGKVKVTRHIGKRTVTVTVPASKAPTPVGGTPPKPQPSHPGHTPGTTKHHSPKPKPSKHPTPKPTPKPKPTPTPTTSGGIVGCIITDPLGCLLG